MSDEPQLKQAVQPFSIRKSLKISAYAIVITLATIGGIDVLINHALPPLVVHVQINEPTQTAPAPITKVYSHLSESLLLEWRTSPTILGAYFVPVYDDGQLVGYTLSSLQPKSPLAVIGLKNGDTITAIDGQPLNDPKIAVKEIAKVRGPLPTLANSSQITIDLTRGQAPIQFIVASAELY